MGNADSHVRFVDGLKRLLVEDVPADDRHFWSSLFTSPLSVEDVFEIIGPDHVRQLRQKRPLNLQLFLQRIVDTMLDICNAADEGALSPSLTTAANTAVRLLTRIVPFLLEKPEDAVVNDILWRPGGYVPCLEDLQHGSAATDVVEACADYSAVEPSAVVVAELAGKASVAEPDVLNAATAAAVEPQSTRTPCGYDILYYIGRFMFLPGYTVIPRNSMTGADRGPVPTHRVDARVVWKGGVGISDQMPAMPSQTHYRARAEVLRCVLACLSGPLFQTAEEYQEQPPKWLLRFTGGEVSHTANLFCSLMSTVFLYDPVGWGVPYLGYFASGTEEDLVDVALQVLCVVMDFDPIDDVPSSPSDGVVKQKVEEAGQRETKAEKVEKKRPQNVYRYMLQNISKDSEIDLIFAGLVRLLSTVHQANQTYLPNSFRSVGFYQEALVLLWHLITLNQSFTRRVVDCLDTNQIILPVLYLLQQAQNAPQLVGLLHTASFVLLVLSSERSFAVRLNEPYSSKIPLIIPQFQGCHADVVALTLYKVISESIIRPQNDALVEMLLTVLCNVSPYIKSFALESCLKLLSLVERCSRPGYIFRSAFTHHGLIFLLEMLNNIIQYQFEGNAMMVYSVLRAHECFQQLANLELPNGVAVLRAAIAPETPGAGEAAAADAPAEAVGQTDGQADEAEGAGGQEESETPWSPSDAWLINVKKKMPLETILCLIDHLAPRIQTLCKENDVTDQDEVLRYLKQTTLVGILPVPHPIVIRTYQASSYTAMWFTSYMWGVIFTRSQRMPLYDWKKIRLVVINQ